MYSLRAMMQGNNLHNISKQQQQNSYGSLYVFFHVPVIFRDKTLLPNCRWNHKGSWWAKWLVIFVTPGLCHAWVLSALPPNCVESGLFVYLFSIVLACKWSCLGGLGLRNWSLIGQPIKTLLSVSRGSLLIWPAARRLAVLFFSPIYAFLFYTT